MLKNFKNNLPVLRNFSKIFIYSLSMNIKLKVVLESQEEGGYTVYVPSLPGCISQGETIEEAMKNIKEATDLYLVIQK